MQMELGQVRRDGAFGPSQVLYREAAGDGQADAGRAVAGRNELGEILMRVRV